MNIGTLKEIKPQENRIGLIPKNVQKLVKSGHRVFIQKNAGTGSGYSDSEYKKAGAKILSTSVEIAKKADIIVKVKEPIEKEYKWLNNFKHKTLFTFLHLAACAKKLTQNLLKNKITAIAYETVENKFRELPLLKPMSEVAGILAIQYGAEFLQKKYDGYGITLGAIKNTENAKVVVLGHGTVGGKSALMAASMGAKVVVFGRRMSSLNRTKNYFKKFLPKKLFSNTKYKISTPQNISKEVKDCHLLIGAVLVRGARAPILVNEKNIRSMSNGSVIVDVAIDQGGCICGSRPTTHAKPIYKKHGKIYCCVTNMPGQVPRQSTQALSAATSPYLQRMANNGVKKTLKQDKFFAKGLNTYDGKITYKAVAEELGMGKYFKEF